MEFQKQRAIRSGDESERERERERQREDKSEIRRKEPGGAGSRNETDYDGGGMEVDLLHRELLKNP